MGNVLLQSASPTEIESCTFVLGSNDPEMNRITQVLSEHDLPFVFAMSDAENRVNPRNAYTTTFPTHTSSQTPIFVECAPAASKPPLLVIDHHRLGDPGYDKTAEEYAGAASIGQLCSLLGLEMSEDDKILAAMDHCFGLAVKGRCPGVSPQDVLDLKIQTLVESHHVDRNFVEGKIQTNAELIDKAPETELGTVIAKDLRSLNLGPGNSLEHLAMVAAQALVGLPLLLTEDDHSGALKTTFRSPNPNDIEYFMTSWSVLNGCVEVYGVPNRGYAGAYLPS